MPMDFSFMVPSLYLVHSVAAWGRPTNEGTPGLSIRIQQILCLRDGGYVAPT